MFKRIFYIIALILFIYDSGIIGIIANIINVIVNIDIARVFKFLYSLFDNIKIFGWIVPIILIVKFPNSNKFPRLLDIHLHKAGVMKIMQENLRDLPFHVKFLLLVSNVIKPTEKQWAGEIDTTNQRFQIMRIPRWYDINPFGVTLNCHISNNRSLYDRNLQTILVVKPIITRAIMIKNFISVLVIYFVLQFIQDIVLARLAGVFFEFEIFMSLLDGLQFSLMVFFPLAFYLEWIVSLEYLRRLFPEAHYLTVPANPHLFV